MPAPRARRPRGRARARRPRRSRRPCRRRSPAARGSRDRASPRCPAIDAVSGPDQCSAASVGSAPLTTSSSSVRHAEAPAEVAPDVRRARVLRPERADVGAPEDAHEPVAERERARDVGGGDQDDLGHGCASPREEVVTAVPEVVGERPHGEHERDRHDDVASSRHRGARAGGRRPSRSARTP